MDDNVILIVDDVTIFTVVQYMKKVVKNAASTATDLQRIELLSFVFRT